MNEILKRNLEVIQQNDELLYQRLLTFLSEHPMDDTEIQVDYLQDGEAVLSIVQNERRWYLNSQYSDVIYRTFWMEQFEQSNYLAPYIIFGFGTGVYIRELMAGLTEQNFVLVVEPNPEVFMKVLSELDVTDILSTKNIIISVKGLNDEAVVEYATHILDYGKLPIIQYGLLPNYLTLYHEDWNDLRKIVKKACDREVMNRNTSIVFATEFAANIFSNLYDLPKQYTINQIKEMCEKLDVTGVPAVIVAAGPSLDKNIEVLKQAKNKALIIATDSALKSLLQHDIIPDIALTVDPHKPPKLFAHTKALSVPMVVHRVSNKYLWTLHQGKRFYFNDGDTFVQHIYEKYTEESLGELNTGGSVANNCYSLARYLGFKTIILMGQDLAYPDNKMHADSVYDRVDSIQKNRKYIEVEDIYGNRVITDYNMEVYLRWFENQIVLHPDIKVIDATEGGAKIAGSEVMTLQAAIDKECVREIDFFAELQNISPIFSLEQQAALYEMYDKIDKKLELLKRKLKDGVKDYEKLLRSYKKSGVDTKEYQKLVKRTGKLTSDLREEPLFSLIEIYNQSERYQVLGEAYAVQSELDDEIEALVKNAIKMLQSYGRAIDKFIEDYQAQKAPDYIGCKDSIDRLRKCITNLLVVLKEDAVSNVAPHVGILLHPLTILLDKLKTIEGVYTLDIIWSEELYKLQLRVLQLHEEKAYEMLINLLEKEYLALLDKIEQFLATQK